MTLNNKKLLFKPQPKHTFLSSTFIILFIVKFQSHVQASALGIGVNFVFPLSQEQQEPPPKHTSLAACIVTVLSMRLMMKKTYLQLIMRFL